MLELRREGKRQLLSLRIFDGDQEVRVSARRFRVRALGEITRKVRGTLGIELTFHGPGPVMQRDIKTAIAETGAMCSLFTNWQTSGQDFGIAFAPPTPKKVGNGELAGALRVVPASAKPADRRGLWLAGNSVLAGAYVAVQPAATTDRYLLTSVVHALANVAGLTWASSGTLRVHTKSDRDRWIRSVTAFLASSSKG